MTDSLTLSVVDSIAYLTINAPPKNEMDLAVFDALSRIVMTEFGTLDVDGVIVSGKGRHFSSGANVPQLIQMGNETDYQRRLEGNARAYRALEELGCPVVAAITGCCLGSGMELALACTYRIATKHAVFALPEITFGLMPGCGGTIRLPMIIGKSKAMEMILSGRTVLADEAREMNLVDVVVEKDALMATAKTMIERSKQRR
jgi:enoyl-CoA hydratase/carnithine racemase